jgi:cystathionine beta-synthase
MMTRRIPREEGIFAGNSAGSAIAGLIQMKDRFKPGDVVVVIFHDHGTRYLGKMFNDEWMRDRGFLEVKSPKAIDIIEPHKHQTLVTIESGQLVSDAFNLMRKYDISQLPVTKNSEFVGSLSDSHLYAALIDNPEIKNEEVEKMMQKSFPFVAPHATLEEVSALINRENDAVLVRDLLNEVHIITKSDIIEAIG